MLTASNDATARIWDADSGEEIHTLIGHRDRVRGATFSPDGTRVLTASNDRTARIWEGGSGKEIQVLQAHQDGVWNAVFSPDGTRILTSSPDRTARIWSTESGEEISALRGHSGPVWNAVFSPDGANALTVSSDGTARIWDVKNGKLIRILSDFDASIYNATFSPNGAHILITSAGSAEIHSVSGERQNVLKGHHTDQVRSAIFSPDSTYVVTTSADQTALALNNTPLVDASQRPGCKDSIQNLIFCPNGSCLLAFCSDGVTCWNAQTGEQIYFLGDKSSVSSAVFSADGDRFYTTSSHQKNVIYDRKSGNSTCEYILHVWDSMTGKKLENIIFRTGRIGNYIFERPWIELLPHTGRVLVGVTNGQRTAGIWDAISGSEACALRDEAHPLRNTQFSPDATRILTVSSSGVQIWNASSGENITHIEAGDTSQEQNDKIQSAMFSPDGSRVLTTSRGGTACVWSATSGNKIFRFGSGIHKATFFPDGTHILTAAKDRTARIWDTESGAEIMKFFLDAEATSLAVHEFNVALGDALGRIHVFETGKYIVARRLCV